MPLFPGGHRVDGVREAGDHPWGARLPTPQHHAVAPLASCSIARPPYRKHAVTLNPPAVDAPVELPPAPIPDPYRDPISLAVVEEVFERGARSNVAGVIARADVTASEFYDRYATLEDCALDAYERFIACFKRRVGGAFNAHSSWRDSLRAAAYETADWMEANPALVGFGMTGVLQMKSELCRVRREEVFVFCGGLIDLGRTEPSEIEVDEAAAMLAIGSIIQLLTFRLQTGGPIEPHAIVPEMMYAVVRTYKGERAAREELERSQQVAVDR